MPKIRLPNGVMIEGSNSQIIEAMNKLGYGYDKTLFYNSTSRGYVLIADMETTHLRNALLKFYAQWVKDLHFVDDPQEVCRLIIDGPSDPTFRAMLVEYSTREG